MRLWTKNESARNESAPRDDSVVLRATHLRKTFSRRKRPAVDDVSFEVRAGQIVSLLGPNGAGKTTSFRMACGMIEGDEGQVFLNGIDVTRWPMHRRVRQGGLGYLPQDRSAFNLLTAEQNLYAAMQFWGYSRSEQRKECARLLKEFHLEDIRRSVVGSGGKGGLSGGELRRLELARAMLTRPRILLLDEPFAAVDPITVTNFKKLILKLAKSGMAILITDHSVADALPFCDYSYIVKDGKILYKGTPIEIVNNREAVTQYLGERAEDVRIKLRRNRDELVNDEEFRATQSDQDDVDAIPPSYLDASAQRRTASSRPTLTLTRQPNQHVRTTPSPRDERREENRFSDSIPRLLKRK